MKWYQTFNWNQVAYLYHHHNTDYIKFNPEIEILLFEFTTYNILWRRVYILHALKCQRFNDEPQIN